jgi:hypothetical protein
MSQRIESLQGSLTHQDGSIRRVALRATVIDLRGHGVEDEAVARVDLRSEAPDGDYRLEYFYLKAYSASVRVRHGILLAA